MSLFGSNGRSIEHRVDDDDVVCRVEANLLAELDLRLLLGDDVISIDVAAVDDDCS